MGKGVISSQEIFYSFFCAAIKLAIMQERTTRFTCERPFALSGATASFSATRLFAFAENARVSAASGRRAQQTFRKEQPLFSPAFPKSAANALFGIFFYPPTTFNRFNHTSYHLKTYLFQNIGIPHQRPTAKIIKIKTMITFRERVASLKFLSDSNFWNNKARMTNN